MTAAAAMAARPTFPALCVPVGILSRFPPQVEKLLRIRVVAGKIL
jgi:hypothetical protein